MKSKKSKKKYLALTIVLFLTVVVGGMLLCSQFSRSNNLASVISSVLVDLTNRQRVSNQISPLATSTLLEQAAKLKVEDMAKRGYFAHQTPEGQDFIYFLKQVGYDYKYAGENLAFDFKDSEDVSRAWMQSPGHKANLLQNKYTEIGIATAEGTLNGKRGTFVAQYFGTPVK